MFKKVSKIMAGGIFFLGSKIMAEPLKDYDSIVDFAEQIHNEGFVNLDLAARIQETVHDGDTHLPIRVYILNRTRVYILNKSDKLQISEEKQEELQGTINNGIQYLLAQNEGWESHVGGYANMNQEMQFAHMLWLSQTENCAGAELKKGWSVSCLEWICEILQEQQQEQQQQEQQQQQQQAENKKAAEALHQKIRKILKKDNIEMNQFEP